MHNGYSDGYDRHFELSARRLESVLNTLRSQTGGEDPFALFALRQHEIAMALLARALERCDTLAARLAALESDVRDLVEAKPVATPPPSEVVDVAQPTLADNLGRRVHETLSEGLDAAPELMELTPSAQPTARRHGGPPQRATLTTEPEELGRRALEEATQGDIGDDSLGR